MSTPQVWALIPRPVFNWMYRVCQRHLTELWSKTRIWYSSWLYMNLNVVHHDWLTTILHLCDRFDILCV